MWFGQPLKITKQATKAVTYLNATNEVLGLRKLQNTMVTKVTRSQYDRWPITINNIIEHDVPFALMVTGYKVYQSSRHNFVSSMTTFATYKILKEGKRYDLCLVLLSELLSNLKKIKQDKKHVFKFGSLIVCLALYFPK